MKPFTEFTYDDAAALFKRVVTKDATQFFPVTDPRRPPVAQSATQFYLGDHWQNTKGFIGQLPPPTLPGAAQILADIKAGFVSENVIQEVTETHVGGILGREPTWSFLKSESPANQASVDPKNRDTETGDSLTPWWNKRKALTSLEDAATTLVLEGGVVRRLFIPRGLFPDGARVTAKDLSSALDLIYFQNHTTDIAGVFTDPDTQKDIGIYLFREESSDGEVQTECAELSFLNKAGDTVCRVVKSKGATEEFGPYQLGGHLLVYELRRRALITEQVQSNQRALNLAHTMMMRNVNMAGARERTITNAQVPVRTRRAPTIDDPTKTVREAGTFEVGAGAVMFLMGHPIKNDNGEIVGYTNPNVTISDPASVETFVATGDHYREAVYSQCHQRHVLIVDKADTSGRAREMARREFERSLKKTKVVVDASGRWQLETALRLAAQIVGKSARYLPLRADFNCLIDAGEPDPEKQKTVLELRKPGGPNAQPLIADETARAWIGVEDPAAELVKIQTEAGQPPGKPAPLEPVQPASGATDMGTVA